MLTRGVRVPWGTAVHVKGCVCNEEGVAPPMQWGMGCVCGGVCVCNG